MFGKFRRDETTIYDRPIERVLEQMEQYDPHDPEWPTLVERLEELTTKKAQHRPKRSVNPDTMFIVLGNLAGILIIVAYEQKHVMTSKGLGFIRPKEPRI